MVQFSLLGSPIHGAFNHCGDLRICQLRFWYSQHSHIDEHKITNSTKTFILGSYYIQLTYPGDCKFIGLTICQLGLYVHSQTFVSLLHG